MFVGKDASTPSIENVLEPMQSTSTIATPASAVPPALVPMDPAASSGNADTSAGMLPSGTDSDLTLSNLSQESSLANIISDDNIANPPNSFLDTALSADTSEIVS